MNQDLINHICFVLDASSSMIDKKDDLIKVVDRTISGLSQMSKTFNQETRVTIYQFSDRNSFKCLVFDKDVLRLPSIASLYKVYGNTALIDATITSIDELSQTFTKYGDHAFLMYVLTDGEENKSLKSGADLAKKFAGLADNWTVAIQVPNMNGKILAEKYGFPKNNIEIWDTSKRTLDEVETSYATSVKTYMTNRAKGIRGTKNLFAIDTANLTTQVIKQNLEELKPSEYSLLRVHTSISKIEIKPFVENWTGSPYIPGSCYYELTKKETIGASKSIAVKSKKNGKIYTGVNARTLLGLPNSDVKVEPVHADWIIYVQSTSVNRHLVSGTDVLLIK